MQGIEVPCHTLKQQRRAVLYVPPTVTWVLHTDENIYELCKLDHYHKDGGSGSTPNGELWLWGRSKGYSLGR